MRFPKIPCYFPEKQGIQGELGWLKTGTTTTQCGNTRQFPNPKIMPVFPSVGCNALRLEVAAPTATSTRLDASAPSSLQMTKPSADEELQARTKARKQSFRIPWRQVSLMASLCFGTASFVLPDILSDNMQRLLYALAAASLYGRFAKRLNANC